MAVSTFNFSPTRLTRQAIAFLVGGSIILQAATLPAFAELPIAAHDQRPIVSAQALSTSAWLFHRSLKPSVSAWLDRWAPTAKKVSFYTAAFLLLQPRHGISQSASDEKLWQMSVTDKSEAWRQAMIVLNEMSPKPRVLAIGDHHRLAAFARDQLPALAATYQTMIIESLPDRFTPLTQRQVEQKLKKHNVQTIPELKRMRMAGEDANGIALLFANARLYHVDLFGPRSAKGDTPTDPGRLRRVINDVLAKQPTVLIYGLSEDLESRVIATPHSTARSVGPELFKEFHGNYLEIIAVDRNALRLEGSPLEIYPPFPADHYALTREQSSSQNSLYVTEPVPGAESAAQAQTTRTPLSSWAWLLARGLSLVAVFTAVYSWDYLVRFTKPYEDQFKNYAPFAMVVYQKKAKALFPFIDHAGLVASISTAAAVLLTFLGNLPTPTIAGVASQVALSAAVSWPIVNVFHAARRTSLWKRFLIFTPLLVLALQLLFGLFNELLPALPAVLQHLATPSNPFSLAILGIGSRDATRRALFQTAA